VTTLSVEAASRDVGLRISQVLLCVVEARPVVLLIYVMRFAVAFALAYPDAPIPVSWRFPVALTTWLAVAGSVYLFDGVMDVVEDRANGSARPIARGALPVRVAATVSAIWAGISVIGAILLGAPYVFLVPFALLLGYAYSGALLRLKRWSLAAGVTVLIAGGLTFLAGGAVRGGLPTSTRLFVFAIAMSAWMGLVGAVAKDFADVPGDLHSGRRTCAVVKGVHFAARRLSVNALLVAAGFVVVAALVDRLLLWPATAVLLGAVAIALACRPGPAEARPRRPYRTFMVTQYAAHVGTLLAIVMH
jgi:4-hydroxybenzoate polyprenyltransferase